MINSGGDIAEQQLSKWRRQIERWNKQCGAIRVTCH